MAKKSGREVLKLDGVCRYYGKGHSRVKALCGISFTVCKNEMVCILGPSGSGKSTLLHIMGLLDKPTEGKVFIDGVDTSGMGNGDQAKIRGAKVGFVFQTFNLINSLTARENVEMPLMIANASGKERRKKTDEILKKVGLGHRLDHYPGQLSGGERQRVAIARALVHGPEVIFADEPTGNLDSKTGEEVLRIFRELHAEGRTIVIITHDEHITRIAERIIRVRDGVMVKNEVNNK